MNIKEHICKDIVIGNTANNLDQQLHKDLPEPLPNYSGFNMAIAGSSGSGKTTLMYSIMTKRKKKGKRQSYRAVFDHIYIVSPTLGNKSMKKDEFSKLPQDQIYRELTLEALAELSNNQILKYLPRTASGSLRVNVSFVKRSNTCPAHIFLAMLSGNPTPKTTLEHAST